MNEIKEEWERMEKQRAAVASRPLPSGLVWSTWEGSSRGRESPIGLPLSAIASPETL